MIKYLKNKGITIKVLKKFNISFKDDTAFFPVYDKNNNKLYTKYRRIGEPIKNPKDSHTSLYGIQFLKENKKVILTEGETDTLSCHTINLPAITSTTGVMSNYTPDMVESLNGKDIYICFDNDIAGHKGMAKIYKTFPEAKFVFLTDEETGINGDLNDFILNNDIEIVRKKFNEATKIVDGFKSHHDIKFTLKESNALTPYKRAYSLEQDDELRRLEAKAVPFRSLMDFNSSNMAICPFHNDTNASLSLKEDKNFVKCFVCDETHDTIGFIMKRDNLMFYEAIAYLVGAKYQEVRGVNLCNHD